MQELDKEHITVKRSIDQVKETDALQIKSICLFGRQFYVSLLGDDASK